MQKFMPEFDTPTLPRERQLSISEVTLVTPATVATGSNDTYSYCPSYHSRIQATIEEPGNRIFTLAIIIT